MRLLIPFLIPALLLSSCSGEEKPPEDVLEQERFEKVLTELYLLEGEAAHRKSQFSTDPKKFLPRATKEVFQEHDVTRDEFVRSYRYYMKDPKRMKKIHEEVLNELMKRKGKGQKEEGEKG